jgi:hypothetical protein
MRHYRIFPKAWLRRLSFAATAMAILCHGSAAKASTYDVDFQFSGTLNTGGTGTETVTGTIVTDCDSCFLQTADVTSWSLNFSGALTGSANSGGLTSPPGISGNVLEATGGNLLYVFDSSGFALFTGTDGASQLAFGFVGPAGDIRVQVAPSDDNILGSVTQPFQIATEEIVTTTPLPAALPLFATCIGGLGLLGWRRKRKNVAAIAA